VRDSHVVIVCISNRSVTKAGYLQKVPTKIVPLC
jgi:hypothetical protein